MSQVNPYAESLQVAKDNLVSAERNVNQANDAFVNAQNELNEQQTQHDNWVAPQEEASEDIPEGEGSDGGDDSSDGAESGAEDGEEPAEQPEEPIVAVKAQVGGIVDAVADLVSQLTDEQYGTIVQHAEAAGVSVADKYDAVKHLIAEKQV